MNEAVKMDQIFVYFQHWLVAHAPVSAQPLVAAVDSVVAILVVFPTLFAITTVLERKGLGRMQNRYGPNRVGPYGFFQPIADGIKSLTKEDVVPFTADHIVHLLAPIIIVTASLLVYAVLPVGRNMVVADLDAGLLFFFAAGSVTELAVFMAGWSSRNKYSLLGAMRGIAQMISYEVPLVLSTLAVVMTVGSLSTVRIVEAQTGHTATLAHWFVFTPWGLAGFVLFLVAATAESNRSPFDLPEGESEIIAGYFVEYSGFKFAMFFMGEYLGMIAIGGIAVTLFLGGWAAPFSFLDWVPSYLWFFLKLLLMIMFFIWVRGTLPRLRMDQLMGLAWKFMLPMTLLNLVAAGVWRFMQPGVVRWLVCAALVFVPYVLLGRGLTQARKVKTRNYRYAE
jgi:NADH-quinone oxidoreductase subunit H